MNIRCEAKGCVARYYAPGQSWKEAPTGAPIDGMPQFASTLDLDAGIFLCGNHTTEAIAAKHRIVGGKDVPKRAVAKVQKKQAANFEAMKEKALAIMEAAAKAGEEGASIADVNAAIDAQVKKTLDGPLTLPWYRPE